MTPALKHHIKTYVMTWAALGVVLAATYIGAVLPLGDTLSIVSNLGFAAVKTALIAWVFMHLDQSAGLTRLTAAAALLFLALMFYLTLLDVLFRAG